MTDNLLVVVLLPVIVAWWAMWVRRATSGRPGGPAMGLTLRHRQLFWGVTVALVLAYTVVRNLPFGAALAPAG